MSYWATSQSCAELDAAHVGERPAAPIEGTLYRCTAPDVWEAYFTPYPYPHPLRVAGSTHRVMGRRERMAWVGMSR